MNEYHDQTEPLDDLEGFFGSHCLSAEELVGFVARTLGEDELARVEDHIEECSLCAAELDAHFVEAVPEVRELAAAAELPSASIGYAVPHPALLQRFRAGLRDLRLNVPPELRWGQALGLSARSSPEPEGVSTDGGVHWKTARWGSTFHVAITSPWRELAGVTLVARIDGVPISGTESLANPQLVATADGCKAELHLRPDAIAARRDALQPSVFDWKLDFDTLESPRPSLRVAASSRDELGERARTSMLLELLATPEVRLRARLETGVYAIEVDTSMAGTESRVVTVRCAGFRWTFGLGGDPLSGRVEVPLEDGPTEEQVADPTNWSVEVSAG